MPSKYQKNSSKSRHESRRLYEIIFIEWVSFDRSPQGPDSDDDDRNLTEEGQEMNRILRKTRLSSGSDASATSSQDIEEEDDDDDLDLDAMASKFMPTKVQSH